MGCGGSGLPWSDDGFDGERYQARFDALSASGEDVHGEADFVMSYLPESVLDAGCGTGRVAIELARRGVYVVGVDRDDSMLSVARARAAELEVLAPGVRVSFTQSDLGDLNLGGSFDVVVMAGNVPLFTPPGTSQALVAGAARHVKFGGVLIAGFQLTEGYSLSAYDLHCQAARLELADRFATWDKEPFAGGGYAVSVHRRA